MAMTTSSVKKVLVTAVGVAAAAAAYAGVTFPSTSGDLADAAAWGLGAVPHDVVTFTASGNYTASADVCFSNLTITSDNSDRPKAVFDLSGSNGKITLDGNTDTDVYFNGRDIETIFRGGSVEVAKNMRLSLGPNRYGNRVVFDGADFVHAGSDFSVGYFAASGNSFVLTNGASATVKAVNISNNGGGGNVMEVNAGCTLTVAGSVYTDSYGGRADGDSAKLLVRGEGALVTVLGSSSYLGYRHDNGEFTVMDGGTLDMTGKSLYFGGNGGSGAGQCGFGTLNVLSGASFSAYNLYVGYMSSNNVVVVSNATANIGYATLIGNDAASGGNTLTVAGAAAKMTAARLRLGGSDGCTGNSVTVADGAELTAMAEAQIGRSGAFNTVTVSNATAQFQGFVIGMNATASNCSVKVTGASANFKQTKNSWMTGNTGYFGAGANGLLEFSGGCTYTSPHPTPVVGSMSDGNVVRITDGATVTGNTFNVGRAATSTMAATSGNRLEVMDGAAYTCGRLYVRGQTNGVVVSNATVNVTYSSASTTNAFFVGFADASLNELADKTSGSFLRLEGATPKIRGTSTSMGFELLNGSRLEFALPSEPYAEPPLVGYQLLMDETSEIAVDVSALAKTIHGRLEYTLFEFAGNVGAGDLATRVSRLPQSVIDSVNAELAGRGASISWSGTRLILSVKGNAGGVIIIK